MPKKKKRVPAPKPKKDAPLKCSTHDALIGRIAESIVAEEERIEARRWEVSYPDRFGW